MRTFLLFSVALTILSAQPLFFPSPPLALQYGPRTAALPSQVLSAPTLSIQQAPLLPYTPRTVTLSSAPLLPYLPTSTSSPAFPYTPRVSVPSAPLLPYIPSSSSTILTPATTTLSAPLLPYTPTSVYTIPDVIASPAVQLYTPKRNPSDVIVDSQGNTHNVFRYGPTEPASANNVLHPIDIPTAVSLITGAPGPKTVAPASTAPPAFPYAPLLTAYGPPRTTVALNYALPSAPAFPYVPTTPAPAFPYAASTPASVFPYVPTTPAPALPYLTSFSTPVSVNPATLAMLSYGPAQSQTPRPTPAPLSPDNTAVYVSAAAGIQRDTSRPVEQLPQQQQPQQQQELQQQLRQQLELQQELLLQQQAQLQELQQEQLDQQQQQQQQEQLQQQQRQQRQQQRQQQLLQQQQQLPLAPPSSQAQPQPVSMPYVLSTPAVSQEQQQQLLQQQRIQQQQQQQLQIQQQQLDQQLQQQQQQLQQQLLQQQQLQQQQQQLLMNQQQLAQQQQQLDLQQQQQNQQRQQQLQIQQLLQQQQLQLSQQQLQPQQPRQPQQTQQPQLSQLQQQQLTPLQQQALLAAQYGTRTVAPTPAPRPTAAPTNYVMPFGWGFTTANLTRPIGSRAPTPANNQDAVTLPRPSRLNASLAQIHGALLQTVNTTAIVQSLPKPTVVSFDFDGTLHDVLVGRGVGNPYPRVVAFLKEFGENGAEVVIVTARLAEDNHLIEAFLARNDVAQYVTQIYNTETSDKTASLIAAGAQVHVDDRAPNLDLLKTTIPTLKLYIVTNGVISAFN